MNKFGKTNWLMIAILIVVAIGLVWFLMGAQAEKTLKEHEEPADISEGETGTGMKIRFYDKDGNLIEIPDWFSTGSTIPLGEYSIVKRVSPPTCVTSTGCPGYIVGGYIMCWQSQCVLAQVDSMDISFTATNPSTSTVSFLNVVPTTVSPAAFSSALTKTTVSKLAPGENKVWTSGIFDITQFEETTTTFNVLVEGTNEYTGETVDVGDSISLVFQSDPTGTFSVVVSSPAP